MTRLAALGLAALATSGAAPHAQGLDEIYPRAALVKDQSRFEQRVRDMFERGLWDFMDGAEKEALSGLRLNFPLIGHHRHPLDFYAYRDGGRPTVDLPVLSLKFIEDLSTAYSWRHVHGYTLEPVDEYVAMLKYRAPGEFPSGRYPGPLSALGVPAVPRLAERRGDAPDEPRTPASHGPAARSRR